MEEKRERVYLCEDSTEGILSAVYEAYYSRYGHIHIRIEEGDYEELNFFCDYVSVETDLKKACAVSDSIRTKISPRAWQIVERATLCGRKKKGQDIYRFLNYGYQMGPEVINFLSNDHIRRVIYDSRTVTRELDRMMGFVRFEEQRDGTLFSIISPKHHLIPLLAKHFADRFPEEKWILYDKGREFYAAHLPGRPVGFFKGTIELKQMQKSDQQVRMEHLWDTFFHTIGIEARKNSKLQRQMMPEYYQTYMKFRNENADEEEKY